jgi:hypothetical protein
MPFGAMRLPWALLLAAVAAAPRCSNASPITYEPSRFRRLGSSTASSSFVSALTSTDGEESPSSAPTELSNKPTISPARAVTSLSATTPANASEGRKIHTAASFLIPLISFSIMAWAAQRNPKVREQVARCCSGEFCAANDVVPDEIVIRPCNSVVGEHASDIELQPVSTFENSSAVWDSILPTDARGDVPRGDRNLTLNIRRIIKSHSWNTLADDPVDEVSLKGSSCFSSSSSGEDRDDPVTDYVRMKASF